MSTPAKKRSSLGVADAGPERSESLRPASFRYVAVARLITNFGREGAMRAELLTDFPNRFRQLRTVYLGEDTRPMTLQRWRKLGDQVLLKFAEINSPEEAALFRGQLVLIPEAEVVPLPEGQYYVYQIIGLEVVTDAGQVLGYVTEVLFTGSNDVYVIQGPLGEILVPAIPDVIQTVDLARQRLVIRPLAGMIPMQSRRPTHRSAKSPRRSNPPEYPSRVHSRAPIQGMEGRQSAGQGPAEGRPSVGEAPEPSA